MCGPIIAREGEKTRNDNKRRFPAVLFTALVSLSLLKSRAAPTPIRIKLLLPPKVYYEKRTGNTRRDELIKKLMFATVLFGLMGFQYRKMQVPQANLVKGW